MASSIQLLRSTNPQERPFPNNLLEGQPAVNINPTEPGLYFKASDGSVVKMGPAAITSDGLPPNSSHLGVAGNSVGELWLDKASDPAVLKVYDGTVWVEAGSGGGGGGGGGSGQYVRWIYTSSTGGETSLSGISGGVLLSYTPGLEEVYINGVLITRVQDYSATTGASITNLSPLVAGDVVTVISTIPVETIQLPGVTSLLRWYKTAEAGDTDLNGPDDAGQVLAYYPGYEQVFVNGVLLRRGEDYSASNGTNIILSSPLSLDDEVTVLAFSEIVIGAITSSDIEDGAITEPKLDTNSVSESKIQDNAVTTDKIDNGAVTSSKIENGTIVDEDVSPSAEISASKSSFTTTNGVARSVGSKLGDIVSVRDFGATGDGTDQTNEVQAAFVEAKARGVSVYFPAGNYLITTTVDADYVSFYGEPGRKSKITCGCPSLTPTIDHIGPFVVDMHFQGDGVAPRDGIRGFTYKDHILGCYFNGLDTAIICDGIIVASVIEDTEILGCSVGISDKAHDGSSAHTTLWMSDCIIHYGGKAFDLKTQAAGFYVRGCVFEDLSYVFYCFYLFDSTFVKCWVEQIYKDCTVFYQAYGGSPAMSNIFQNFSLRKGSKTITDSVVISSGQVPNTGFNLGGGVRLDTSGIKVASTQAYGFILGTGGIKPAAAQANFSDPGDFTVETMNANGNKTSPGGDVVFTTGSGSNGSRRGAVIPGDDDAITLGLGSNRWKEVFAGAPAINTSDARLKEQERDPSDAERAVALKAKKLLKAFKFKDAVEKKGDSARVHFGIYAQELAEAFSSEGLNAEDYAMFCYDEWEEKRDENGELIRPAGNSYGVRYEELLAFIISAL